MRKFRIYFNRQISVMKIEIITKIIASAAVFGITVFATHSDVCSTFEATKSAVFALVMCAFWCGIFNTILLFKTDSAHVLPDIQENLVSPQLYVAVNVSIQLLVSVIQALIATMFFSYFDYDRKGIVCDNATLEIFLTFFLIIFSAATQGMLVSTFIQTIQAAVTVIPPLLIVQLLFCRALFEVNKHLIPASDYVESKFGIAALGSILDMNQYPISIVKKNPDLGKMIHVQANALYEHTANHLEMCWLHLLILAVIPVFVCIPVIYHRAFKKI